MSLQIYREQKNDILALNGKTQKDLDNDLEILKEWIKQEQHLPRSLLEENSFLEICLIRNKYLMEKTKSKIEHYCTLKRKYSYLLEDYIRPIEATKEPVFYHYIDVLTEEFQRIIVYKILDGKNHNVVDDIGIGLLMRELTSRFDYNNGEILILDLSRASINLIKQSRLNLSVPTMELTMKGHSARIKQMHVINKWAGTFITFFKTYFPEKLMGRVYGHETIDTLQNYIPKKYLPSDYGGDQKKLADIRADWDKIFKDNFDLMKAACNTMSNEELRIGSSDTIELQGTFKKLLVD